MAATLHQIHILPSRQTSYPHPANRPAWQSHSNHTATNAADCKVSRSCTLSEGAQSPFIVALARVPFITLASLPLVVTLLPPPVFRLPGAAAPAAVGAVASRMISKLFGIDACERHSPWHARCWHGPASGTKPHTKGNLCSQREEKRRGSWGVVAHHC